jgi:hypothetical protein
MAAHPGSSFCAFEIMGGARSDRRNEALALVRESAVRVFHANPPLNRIKGISQLYSHSTQTSSCFRQIFGGIDQPVRCYWR